MKNLLLAAAIALTSVQAFAQASGSAGSSLATKAGNDVNISLGSYKYVEPDSPSISIHGVKLGGEYTGTIVLDRDRHWFLQAGARGTAGSTTYDGWCYPFLIRPNRASPNGYELGLGDPSPCSESGDKDWYLETRGLIGKDLIGDTWAFSPYAGLGYRHLSNGTNGVPGYRTQAYLYVPFGITARTRVASRGVLSFNLEYDQLLHGWNTTRGSLLGGGDVPATPTAPAFTLEGFSDVSFDQHGGRAFRASARYQFASRWSVEPYYIYWSVNASPDSPQTATFTVNGVTAQQQFGAYEPRNFTHEFGVKLGVHF